MQGSPRGLAFFALCLLPLAAQCVRLPGLGGQPCPDLRVGSVTRDSKGGWAFSSSAAGGVAWGSYLDGLHTRSNFGQLRVTTSGEHPDADQLYAAGFLEGYLTARRIWDNWVNMFDYFTRGMGAEVEQPMRWIQEQDSWLRGRCAAGDGQPGGAGDEARFWQSVCLLLRQFDGLKDGYRAAAASADDAAAIGDMSDWDFLFLQSNADLYDIIDAGQPNQRPSWIQGGAEPRIPTVRGRSGGRHWAALDAATREDPERAAAKLFSQVALSGKCSALIKLAPDLSDIFMGHSTWDTYTAQLRIYKHYAFDLRQLRPAASRLSFSSYPGELFSDDDFFLMDSGLVLLQTTNKIFNDELFDLLDTRTVLSWQRVRTANWLARDGQEWAALLDTHNSGTYCNTYMVLDLSKFRPGEALEPGLLWVAEQIPGLVVAADMTQTLAFGYWPSFNVPYFPEIYNRSGYPDFISRVEKHGQHFGRTTHWLSYQNSPRARIFRRDQAGIRDLEGAKRVLRSNRWKTDPLSEGHPIAAVCGRGDLDPENPVARGCFDTKVTSWSMAQQMQAEVVNGPTTDFWPWSVPPFRWSEAVVANMTHRGQPERFAFSFERMDPAAPLPALTPRCAQGAAAAALQRS